MSNGATGSGECRGPEGSVPLPTSAECPFGRLYCKVFARTGDLSLAGDARRKTKKATVVKKLSPKEEEEHKLQEAVTSALTDALRNVVSE